MEKQAQMKSDTFNKPFYLWCPKRNGFSGYKISEKEPKAENVAAFTIVLKFEPTI